MVDCFFVVLLGSVVLLVGCLLVLMYCVFDVLVLVVFCEMGLWIDVVLVDCLLCDGWWCVYGDVMFDWFELFVVCVNFDFVVVIVWYDEVVVLFDEVYVVLLLIVGIGVEIDCDW